MSISELVGCVVVRACGPQAGLSLDRRLADLAGHDVYCLVDVLVELEKRFDARFSSSEIDKLVTVGDLVACVEQKISFLKLMGFGDLPA